MPADRIDEIASRTQLLDLTKTYVNDLNRLFVRLSEYGVRADISVQTRNEIAANPVSTLSVDFLLKL